MRVLLKITGEALGSSGNFDYEMINRLGELLLPLYSNKIEIGIVIGGGNLFRGKSLIDKGFSQTKSHYIGMISTLMNAIVLQEILSSMSISASIFSAIDVPRLMKFFTAHDAEKAYKNNSVCIYCGGTGNPYFTTDSAAALRALETNSSILIKATKVNGVFSSDPVTYPDAVKLDFVSYDDYITKKLKVMDITSIELCKQKNIPILICNYFDTSIFENIIIKKQKTGSLIYKENIWPF